MKPLRIYAHLRKKKRKKKKKNNKKRTIACLKQLATENQLKKRQILAVKNEAYLNFLMRNYSNKKITIFILNY